MTKIAVLGYGTVGSGVVEVIERNREEIGKRCGGAVQVKYILDIREFPGDPYEALITNDFEKIVNDEEIKIVCEVMGGAGAAYKFTKAALERGISVCTSNKELVALHGPELLKIAEKNSCSYLFEASVGGGIPIIRPLNTSLNPEKIESIMGILNGTTNYILTRMEREGADFGEVLKEAQAMGYAEANPAADVEGHDACRKIAILSSLMTGKHVDSAKIPTEGITKITPADFLYADAAGYTVKLLGQSKLMEDGSVLALVSPCMVSKAHPMAMVSDVFNAIYVSGNMVGDTMYYGRGAGKLPTASAVVSDVMACAKSLGENIPCLWDSEEVALADNAQAQWKYFVRVKASAAKKVQEVFGTGLLTVEGRSEDYGCITALLSEREFAAKYESLGEDALGRIRIVE